MAEEMYKNVGANAQGAPGAGAGGPGDHAHNDGAAPGGEPKKGKGDDVIDADFKEV
jgi:hypothetical protein